MTTLFRRFRSLVQALFFACAVSFAMVGSALAQGTSNWAHCSEITDPDIAEQMDYCRAHLGCRMVLNIQSSCAAARSFLDRLRARIGEGVSGFLGLGRDRSVQSEHIWDSLMTPAAREVDALPEWRARSEAIAAAVAKADRTVIEGKSANGGTYVHIGEVRDGQANGYGTRYTSGGIVARGQFRNSQLEGQGEYLWPSGSLERASGVFKDSLLNGQGVMASKDGSFLTATFSQGKPVEGVYRSADGQRYEGIFDGPSGRLVSGTIYDAQGRVREKGTWRDGSLYIGERYQNGQVTERVNRAEEATRLAETRQREALDRQRREVEQREAAARQFESDLQTLAPAQLILLADQMKSAGRLQDAQRAWRALVSRFPDHALASVAIEALAQARGPLPSPAAPPPPVASTASSGSDARSAASTSPGFAGGGAGAGAPGANTQAPSMPANVAATECGASYARHSVGKWLGELPKDNPVVQLRGAIAAMGVELGRLQGCQADSAVAARILTLLETRAAAMRTCRQIASVPDTCAIHPFLEYPLSLGRASVRAIMGEGSTLDEERYVENACRVARQQHYGPAQRGQLGPGYTGGSFTPDPAVVRANMAREAERLRREINFMNNSVCNRMPRQWFDSMMSSLRQNLASAERGAGGAAPAQQRGNTCGDGRPVPANGVCIAR